MHAEWYRIYKWPILIGLGIHRKPVVPPRQGMRHMTPLCDKPQRDWMCTP